MVIGAAIEVADTCRKAADADASVLSDDELMAQAGDLERARSLLDAASARRLAELEARGVTVTHLGLSTGNWAARQGNGACASGRRRVHVAEKVRRHLPSIDQAWADGRLSTAHVETLVGLANPRVIADVAALSEQLIELAAETTFERWRLHVATLIEHLDQDGGYRPDSDPDRNRLSITPLFDGTYQLHGEANGVVGAALSEAIQREADRLFRRYRDDHTITSGAVEIPGRARLLMEALANLVGAGAVDTAPAGSAPADVTIIVEDDDHAHPRTSDDVTIPRDEHLRCRLCDPVIRRLVLSADGAPLDLGRSVRLGSPEQRRAARRRDGGCVFPGCDRPARWTDLHHVQWFEHDGPTDLPNLACLCRFHHGITHRSGWAMHATDDQWFWWTTPFGDSFWSQRHGGQRAGPTPDRC